jgi:flagellar protein FlgJ
MLPPILPSTTSTLSSVTSPQAKDDPSKVLSAAEQFEALLLGQMMKSMSDSEGGWMGTDQDDAASSAMEYGQEMFAQSMAAQGGLGMAKLLAAGLTPENNNSAPSGHGPAVTKP